GVGSSGPPPGLWIQIAQLSAATTTHPACWSWSQLNVSGFTNQAILAIVDFWAAIESQYPPCPGVVAATASQYAAEYLYQIPLPSPRPSAPPGYGITGKEVYLLAGDAYVVSRSFATPLGTLSITITGTYTVNWGDGTSAGPYNTPGGPWPAGTIIHTYDFVGAYTITVSEAWTATWTLAGKSGTLADLVTTGTIPAFRVKQIEAVQTG
ncbi:MAG: hypothetical protein M0Z42_13405, partial [Actinomycetota bacterium]|nr:hypothetical protein [Actinomycetota bacterium]